jgi:hypothetical protein
MQSSPKSGAKRHGLRWLVILLIPLAVFYLAGFLYLWIWGDGVVFDLQPPSYIEKDCAFIEGKIGKRIAYRTALNPESPYWMLYSHGSSGDLGQLDTHVEAHRRFGFNVIIYDYPGVGLSTGPVSEQGCYETIDAVYQFLHNEQKVPQNRILLYGRSIGSGPTLYLAQKEDVGGVVLVSPFTSALGVAFLTSIFPFEIFPNDRRIGSARSSMLILHGHQDENIPVHDATKLHRLAPSGTQLQLIDGFGHTDIHRAPGYWQAINEFVNGLLKTDATPVAR